MSVDSVNGISCSLGLVSIRCKLNVQFFTVQGNISFHPSFGIEFVISNDAYVNIQHLASHCYSNQNSSDCSL